MSFFFQSYDWKARVDPLLFGSCWKKDEQLSADEVVERYHQFGIGGLQGLSGEFALIFSDQQGLHVIRDPIGVIPVYYHIGGSRLVVGSSLRDFISRNSEPKLDEDYLARLGRLDFYDRTSTPLCGVKRAEPGCVTHFISGKGERYFSPSARRVSREEAVTEIADILNAGLGRRAQQQESHGLLLSGGFDSSLIAKVWPQESLLTASMIFDNQKADDRAHLADVIRDNNKISAEILAFEDVRDQLEQWPSDIRIGIFYDPTLWMYRPLMLSLKRRGCQVIMSGLGGDDLFSRPPTLFQSICRRAPARLILLLLKCLAKFNLKKGAVPPKEVFQKAKSSMQYLTLDRFVYSGIFQFSVEQEQELAQSMSLRMSYPLLDSRLVALASSLNKKWVKPEPASKPLLREVGRKYLGATIANYESPQDYTEIRQRVIDDQMQRDLSPFAATLRKAKETAKETIRETASGAEGSELKHSQELLSCDAILMQNYQQMWQQILQSTWREFCEQRRINKEYQSQVDV